MLPATLLASLALAFTPAPAAVAATAGVPVGCVDDAQWTASFPAAVGAADGLFDTQSRVIYLRTVECARLGLLVDGARPRSIQTQYELASSVFVLAHEMSHAQGIDDERQADCNAGLTYLRVTARLGIGRAFGRVLASYLVNARIPDRCYPAG